MLHKVTLAAFCTFVCAFSSLMIINSCKKSNNNGIVGALTGNWVCSGTWYLDVYLVDSNGSPALLATDTTFNLIDTLVVSTKHIDSGIFVKDLFAERNYYSGESFSGYYPYHGNGSSYFYSNYDDPYSYKGKRIQISLGSDYKILNCSIYGGMGSNNQVSMTCTTKFK